MRDLIELIRVVGWPVLVAAALVSFYGPLSEFLKDLGKRAMKLSILGVAFELPKLEEAPNNLIGEISKLHEAGHFASTKEGLAAQLRTTSDIDYAVIDLGDGRKWLTSRLFISAVMLERLRNLRCFVFVCSENKEQRIFVGTALPGKVRWALAQNSPWLEKALADAYQGVVDAAGKANAKNWPSHTPLILSTSGRLDPEKAVDMLVQFLTAIQDTGTTSKHENWEELKDTSPQAWERAHWIDRATVDSDLRLVLQRSSVIDSPHVSRSERAKSILGCEGPFVALLEPNKRFHSLIDRQRMLDRLAELAQRE